MANEISPILYPILANLIPSKKACFVTCTNFLSSSVAFPTMCVLAASPLYPFFNVTKSILTTSPSFNTTTYKTNNNISLNGIDYSVASAYLDISTDEDLNSANGNTVNNDIFLQLNDYNGDKANKKYVLVYKINARNEWDSVTDPTKVDYSLSEEGQEYKKSVDITTSRYKVTDLFIGLGWLRYSVTLSAPSLNSLMGKDGESSYNVQLTGSISGTQTGSFSTVSFNRTDDTTNSSSFAGLGGVI